jgi:hypothetical protein
MTDAAVNGEDMLIDDVSVDAINYFSDFESDKGGWDANGFVRVQNALPQTFRQRRFNNHCRDDQSQRRPGCGNPAFDWRRRGKRHIGGEWHNQVYTGSG